MADLKTADTTYPASVDTFGGLTNGVDRQSATVINQIVTAIIAIENELGTGLRGLNSTLLDRLAICLGADGGLASGTSFPLTPVDGQLYRRTDYTPPKIYHYNALVSSWQQFTTNAETLQGYLPSTDAGQNIIPVGETDGRLRSGWLGATTVARTANAMPEAGSNGKISSLWVSSYTSTDFAMNPGSVNTFAHGLGAVPRFAQIILVCQSAEYGYNAGDLVLMGNNSNGPGYSTGQAIYVDATNIGVRQGNWGSGYCYTIYRRNAPIGQRQYATLANWKVRVKCFL